MTKMALSGVPAKIHRESRSPRDAEAEKELLPEHLISVLDDAYEAIVSVDCSLRIVAFNGGAERLFGYPRSEMLGQPLDRLVPEELRDRHRGAVMKFAQSNETGRAMGRRGLVPALRSDGREVPVEASIYKSRTPLGTVMTAVLIDNSARARDAEDLMALVREKRHLARRLIEVQELERRHLARDLHDELGQCLTVIEIGASMLRELCNEPSGEASGHLSRIERSVANAQEHMRGIIRCLRPAALDQFGLEAAIEDCVERLGMASNGTSVSIELPELPDLNSTIQVTTYRVLQECLTNVARHAEATRVRVRGEVSDKPQRWLKERHCRQQLREQLRKERQGPMLCLEVVDNGRGIDIEEPQPGHGLEGMQERCAALGGALCASPGPAGGTRVVALLPYHAGETLP